MSNVFSLRRHFIKVFLLITTSIAIYLQLISADATAIRAYRISFPQDFIYELGFTIEETGNSNCLVSVSH